MSDRPMFEMSADTRFLRQRLVKAEVNEVITYKELGGLISRTVDASTASLQSARRSLLNHENMVFATIRKLGVKRLDDKGKVAMSGQYISSVRRKARGGAKVLSALDNYTAMSTEDQLSATIRRSVLEATAAMSTDRSMDKLSAKIKEGRPAGIPFAETIKAFLE